MISHIQLYDSNWQDMRGPQAVVAEPGIANLSFPAEIPFPLQIYGCSYIQYDWELLVEAFLDQNISNYRNRISNPNEVDYGYINSRSNNYVRERYQIGAELLQLCGSSRQYQFPNSDAARPARYSNDSIPIIYGANTHEFGLCLYPYNTVNPRIVQVAFNQLNFKIKDFQLDMRPVSRPIQEYLEIAINPSQEQEIDQFSYYLRPGVVGQTRLIVRMRLDEQAIPFASAHEYDVASEGGGFQPACGVSGGEVTVPEFISMLPPQTVCPDPCAPDPNPCNAPPGFEYCCSNPLQPGCAIS